MEWSKLKSKEERRYDDDIDDYLDELGVDWHDDVYYLSDEMWDRDVRRVLADGYELLQSSYSSYRKRRGVMTQAEKVNAYRYLLLEVWEVYRDVAVNVDEVDVDGVHDDVVETAVKNFDTVTAVVMRGSEGIEDERRVIEHILS